MRTFISFIIAFAAIAQVSADQRSDEILIQGNPAGTQTVQTDSAGITHVEYSYNDRGRGDHIVATWKLDTAGVPTEYEAHGNDYMKAPVEERFEIKDGKAQLEKSQRKRRTRVSGEAFYVPVECAARIYSGCWRVLCSKRLVTSCRYCPPVRRASRRQANSLSRARPTKPN